MDVIHVSDDELTRTILVVVVVSWILKAHCGTQVHWGNGALGRQHQHPTRQAPY